MVYTKLEVSTHADSGHTYVLVHFWADAAARDRGEAPSLVNDFLMQLRPTGERIVPNAAGHFQLKDGSFISREEIVARAPLIPPPRPEEFERESFTRDLVA